MIATRIIIFLLVFTPFCLGSITNWVASTEVNQTLSRRLNRLREVALVDSEKRGICSESTFVFISEYAFGNSGNHIISLSHGLWIAKKLNATLIIPNWIDASLRHFDLSVLARGHCFTEDSTIPKDKKLHEITSEESFFVFKLFRDKKLPFIPLLPPLNSETVLDISKSFLRVYAALWSSPSPSIIAASEWIIANHLQSKFDFTSIHKRNLDGGCGKIMSENTKPGDFSEKEVPLDSPEWQGDLRQHHPLCEMSLDFVKSTMALNGREGRNMFVAHDGQGDVSSYKLHRAVFSNVADQHPEYGKMPMKFVDMFVAMQADLFIQNPRSTFSLQIFIVRVCLGLTSVPKMTTNDIYVQRVPYDLETSDRPLMVSWTSLETAFNTFPLGIVRN